MAISPPSCSKIHTCLLVYMAYLTGRGVWEQPPLPVRYTLYTYGVSHREGCVCSPIIEAFGNAKTTRNNNSRFVPLGPCTARHMIYPWYSTGDGAPTSAGDPLWLPVYSVCSSTVDHPRADSGSPYKMYAAPQWITRVCRQPLTLSNCISMYLPKRLRSNTRARLPTKRTHEY